MADATRARGREGLSHFIYGVLEVPPDDASTAGDPDHPVTRYLEATGIFSAQQLAFDATEDNLTSTVLQDTGGTDITGTITLSTNIRTCPCTCRARRTCRTCICPSYKRRDL
jgi:hypothetical protein